MNNYSLETATTTTRTPSRSTSDNHTGQSIKVESVKENTTANNENQFNSNKVKTGGALQSKNVRIHDRRTSVRLEPEMWNALNEIAALEGCSIHDLCGAVHDLKNPDASFTAALRVFMMEYYRTAAITSSKISNIQKRISSKVLGNKTNYTDNLPNGFRG